MTHVLYLVLFRIAGKSVWGRGQLSRPSILNNCFETVVFSLEMLMALTFADWLQWKVSNPVVLQSTSPFCLVPGEKVIQKPLKAWAITLPRWKGDFLGQCSWSFALHPNYENTFTKQQLKITTLGSAERYRHMFLSGQSLSYQNLFKKNAHF